MTTATFIALAVVLGAEGAAPGPNGTGSKTGTTARGTGSSTASPTPAATAGASPGAPSTSTSTSTSTTTTTSTAGAGAAAPEPTWTTPSAKPTSSATTAASAPPPGDPSSPAGPDLTVHPGPLAPYAAPAAGGALRVAVPHVKPQGELPERIVAAFEHSLVVEIRKLEGVSCIGMADIKDMLSFEYQRQLLGSSPDDKTLTQVGRALGVDELVAVQLVLADQSWVVQARRFEMRSAKVLQTEQRRLRKGRGDELLLAVGGVVQGLYPDRSLKAGKSRGVAKELLVRLFPPPLPRWAFLSTAGAALVAGAAGGWYGLSARDAKRDYDAAATAAITTPISGAELKAKADRMDSRARTANVFYAVGGALAIGAAVEAFFTDWHGYRASAAALASETGGGVSGAMISMGGSY